MTYRNDGVDLGTRKDGTLQVAGLEPGEWLQYTVEATQAGRYALRLQGSGAGKAWVQLNGTRLQGVLDAAGTRTLAIELAAGRNTLVVGAEDGRFDLQALGFSPLR
jgi:hypothetical protein